jgi:hypothetical protein
MMMDYAELITPLIFNRKWSILESDLAGVFITSDNPVWLTTTTKEPQTEKELYEKGTVILPISPSRCLVLGPGKARPFIPVVGASIDAVRYINGGTMFYAYQDIYAHYESQRIKRNFDKTKEGEAFKLVQFPDK